MRSEGVLTELAADYSQVQALSSCSGFHHSRHILTHREWNLVIFLSVLLVPFHYPFPQLRSFFKSLCQSVVTEILASSHFYIAHDYFLPHDLNSFLKIKYEKCYIVHYNKKNRSHLYNLQKTENIGTRKKYRQQEKAWD